MRKAIFFAPHSYIWLHAYPEALIAEALVDQGFDVHYITCGRALNSWCVAMESIGANENLSELNKNKICTKCEQNKDLLLRHFNFANSSLDSYLEYEDSLEIESILSKISKETLFDFKIDGLNIGRASLYNFTINRKKHFERNFSDAEWQDFLKHFKSSLISFYAGKNMLAQLAPDHLFFYSSSYSINLVVRLQAEKLGIPCFSIYAGSNWENRLQKMHISSIDSFSAYKTKLELWDKRYSVMPATREGLESALIQQKTLLAGKHIMVYGGGNARLLPDQIKGRWGIPKNSKVLFIATSSYDELLAAQVIQALPEAPIMAFGSQIEWIARTIEFVASRQDLTLIIRVHPREFPNRREAKGSEHSLQLIALFRELPENVKINWPDDGMSLYDWLEIIDLGLTSWSSAGKEFALWGIPNLSYTNDISFYPKKDIGFVGETPDEYFKQIDNAIEKGWSKQRILLAYRWAAYELEGSVFDLSDIIPAKLTEQRTYFWKIFDKLTRYRLDQIKWLWYHRHPIKQAALVAKRVLTGQPTEKILEAECVRLSTAEEVTQIMEVISEIADVRFGKGWRNDGQRSALMNNLARMLAS